VHAGHLDISWTEGSDSPAASIPEPIASRSVLTTYCQAGRPLGVTTLSVHELGLGRVGLWLAASLRPLEQLAQLDLRRPFRLTGLPQPDFAACQRIGSSVDLHPPRPARQLLYVSGRPLTYDITVTRTTDTRSTRTMINMVFCLVGRQGVEP